MSAAFDLGSEASAAQAAGETGNAGTPGQAAYEARMAHAIASGSTMPGWDILSPGWREGWEAAAQAAIDAFLAGDSVSAESIREALAAREPHAAPGDAERALAALAAERNQYRTALERIADGSRSRITMMGCANRALAEHPQPEAPHAAPDQVAITRAAAANTIRKLRELIAELLAELATYGEGCLEPDEIANWRKRGGLEES